MSDQVIHVYIDLDNHPQLVGRLWTHSRKGRESASFEYDSSWLQSDERFSLEPLLALTPGVFHTGSDKSMFGAIGDSAPDRWGRVLMRRAARQKSALEGKQINSLSEMDYLLRVNDYARQGALRFAEQEGGPFLAVESGDPVPPLIDLPKLLSATQRFLDEKESADDLRLLLAPGSSLGGARPKASIKDRAGHLSFAKFSRKDDEFDYVAWEAVALTLAKSAGIDTPEWRLENLADKRAIIIRRFDRQQTTRIPFLSAMSMIGAKDNELHSYLELVDAIKMYGASPLEDMKQLWRRIVFSILISNTDDHLRNHAFLYSGPLGWKLSPAYDMNPVPIDIKPRILTTLIDLHDSTASIELALSVSDYFELKNKEALEVVAEVAQAVAAWRHVARKLKIKDSEIERMSSAFEHDDMIFAIKC